MSRNFEGWRDYKGAKPGEPKYKNKKFDIDGLQFDSKKEARRFLELRMKEQAGVITELQTQKEFLIEVNGILVCKYIADFTYQENGKYIVEDTKGFRTKDYQLKKKLMFAARGIEIKET